MAAAGRLPSFWALLAPLLGGLALLGVGPVPARALHNVTAELFGAEAWGTLAAFGDLNSDKQTDLFVLRESQCLSGPPSVRCPCAPPGVPTPPSPDGRSSCISQPFFPNPVSPFISSILCSLPVFSIFSSPGCWPGHPTV